MNVSLIQSNLVWEDREKNLRHFEELLKQLQGDTHLIVLPEMFSTGFSMNPAKVAEAADGPSLQWMKVQSKQCNAVITGSLAVHEDGQYYNRLYWVQPDGSVSTYNKRHLFRMAGEDKQYTAGTERLIVKLNNWMVCPMICYDLRFPVWSRNRFRPAVEKSSSGTWEYDVLLYVANWPEVRQYPWKQLLIARAIENQCYVIGLNRVGKDGNNYNHSGHSLVINPRGEVISNIPLNEEAVSSYTLDMDYLTEFRKNFPVGLDADRFEINE